MVRPLLRVALHSAGRLSGTDHLSEPWETTRSRSNAESSGLTGKVKPEIARCIKAAATIVQPANPEHKAHPDQRVTSGSQATEKSGRTSCNAAGRGKDERARIRFQ
jgi:hypothetical protein